MGFEHVIPQFILRMLKLIEDGASDPMPFVVQGTGQQTRAFVYIDDFIDGLSVAMRSGEHLGIYNIGTMEETTIEALAHAVADCLGQRIALVPSDASPGAALRRCPDIRKLSALGYQPKVTLRQALPAVVAWYRDHAAPRGAESRP
jgi:nucleoside-diphosphate-sugar epimerase